MLQGLNWSLLGCYGLDMIKSGVAVFWEKSYDHSQHFLAIIESFS